ncbi:hypothetical protein Cni_G29242 [Canna indica]|uniref:Calmodulin binding protein-like N-terminal domain-containing protein n=1 Tax=Canna indica TaxID=4628 RepID=A0AAQ3L6W1_9LILI|nr:hypothetical protein Cni_G29242 [Canna indica]
MQLKFKNKLSLPTFTGSRIEGEDSSTISVALVDALSGQVVTTDLTEGIGVLGELSFTDNSSWIRSRKFRLGARIVDGHFNRIAERGLTERWEDGKERRTVIHTQCRRGGERIAECRLAG